MAKSSDLTVRLNATTGEFEKGFKSAEASAKSLERELNKVENAQRQMAQAEFAAYREMEQRSAASRQMMTQAGTVAMAAGATVAIGMGLAAKAAMDWESAWAGVTKTVDGSPEQMAALEKELRNLATTLPATHEEIAGVAEAAGQLGVKRADVAAFTKTAIDMGESTNLSAEEAATGLAQLGNVMGVLPGEADRAGSALVALGNNGASTEADILAMSLRISGAGKTIGATEAEVMGLASGLSSVGIEAEAGGSAISRVMVDIASAVDEGGESLDGFARVAGMSSAEFSRAYKQDATGAILSFVEGLGRMQESGQSTFKVLDDLGLSEVRVRDALLRSANAGDLLRESVELGSQAWAENSALVDEANKRYQTSEARLQMARNQLNDAAIDIGANVLPALAGAAERVGSLAEAFHNLPEPVQQGVTALGGIAATAGLAGGAALVLIPKLHELHTVLGQMGPRGQSAAKGLGAIGGVLGGPWGIALAGATLALGIYAEKQFQASRRVDELSTTLDQQTGAITDNTRAHAVNRLEQEGAFEAAEALGLSLETVTDAALGVPAAMREVDAVIRSAQEGAKGSATNYDEMGNAITTSSLHADELQGSLGRLGGELQTSQEQTRRKAEAMGEDAAATDEATTAVEAFDSAQAATNTTVQEATDAIEALHKALDDMNGIGRNSIESQIEWEQAVAKANEALKENGKGLDLTTEKGQANMDALLAMAKAADETAEAVHRETGSEAAMRESNAKSREALAAMARSFGLGEAEAWALVDSILAVPPSTETVAVMETEAALARLQEFQDKLNGIGNKTVTLTVNNVERRVGLGPTLAEAHGGVVDYYAGGGLRENHVAQIAPAGAWRMWAEPETGGEAYIPLSSAKRERSTAILSEVADRFGYSLSRFADGGFSGRGGATQVSETYVSQRPIVLNGPVTFTDLASLEREASRMERQEQLGVAT